MVFLFRILLNYLKMYYHFLTHIYIYIYGFEIRFIIANKLNMYSIESQHKREHTKLKIYNKNNDKIE